MSSEALPNLISELMSSKCDGDRLRTRARFEQHSEILDAKLNHLIKSHSPDLSRILESTSKSIQVVSTAKEKCRALKERIISCKEILQCKRDDLRRLWLESLEHKYVYQILEEIGRLRKIPATVNDHLAHKKYLQATEILVSSLSILEEDLRDTEGLKNLRCELHRLIDRLYSVFLEELTQELYMSTFHTVFQGKHDVGFEEVTYEKVFSSEIVKNSTKSIDFNVAYVTTLLECMSLMGKIPETVEILKEECQNELMKIVHKLSKYMYDIIQKSTDTPVLDLPVKQGQQFLVDLLETITGHFRQISLNNKIFLHILGKSSFHSELEEICYQMADIYSNMQGVIEYFVTNYLEIQPVSTLPRQNLSVFSNSQNISDLSDFFLPKNYTDGKCLMLFKFRNSSQGLIGNRKKVTYDNLREKELQLKNSAGDRNSKKLTLVCKPSLRNITYMFDSIKTFVSEIESALDIEPGDHCPLHAFIFDCANNFLDQVNSEINRILENASLNLESWSVSTLPDNTSDREGSEKQILTSTVILNDNLKELQKLLSNLPDYSNHFLQLIYYVILDYKDLVHKVFKSLFDEEQNILSVSWAKDRDIRRLLKSFSNWKFLSVAESGEIIESPEDIRLRNKEESELLIRNLHSEEHESWEIINDCTVLFNLAVLQESLQWFSEQLLTFVEDFKYGSRETHQERPEGAAELHALNAATGLKKLAKEYEDFSDVCLLALHLEVRAHCFHHLLSNNTTEDDPSQAWETSIKSLTDDLMKIDETLVSVLSPKEMKYVFEGLGELIASILIHSVSDTTKVNESLVKRMHRGIFAIQCCLSNITMTREVSLERARQYIQLLNQTCDEILNDILEEGAMFKEHEYASIFRLVLDKAGSDPQMLSHFESKLHEIFKRVSLQT
ncbi:exocyst complex component 4-like isoform X1 [Argiope bruennichi]|uniref:exocyst complex component 4-like isoform X1 n=1 Tax=Argiope bruennichi TaxID=94029 RepID=UPI0024953F1A|nr:exocyst complex component 4-like isoform X1 [Argiope bruennichi]